MTVGARPKPTALKVLEGTARPDRANPAEPKPAELKIGTRPPRWLRDKLAWVFPHDPHRRAGVMGVSDRDYIDRFLRDMQAITDRPGSGIDRISIKFGEREVEVAKHEHMWFYPRPWPSGGWLVPASIAVEQKLPSAVYAVCRKCGQRGA